MSKEAHRERPRALDEVSGVGEVDYGPVVDGVHADGRMRPIEHAKEDDEPPIDALVVGEQGEVVVGLCRRNSEKEGGERRSNDESSDRII